MSASLCTGLHGFAHGFCTAFVIFLAGVCKGFGGVLHGFYEARALNKLLKTGIKMKSYIERGRARPLLRSGVEGVQERRALGAARLSGAASAYATAAPETHALGVDRRSGEPVQAEAENETPQQYIVYSKEAGFSLMLLTARGEPVETWTLYTPGATRFPDRETAERAARRWCWIPDAEVIPA